MATIFTRGFVRRSLPALLALVLGFLVAPQPAPSAFATANAGTTAAADLDATARTNTAETLHTGQSTPAAPPVTSEAPIERSTEQISALPRTLRVQVTADTYGSRAPPSALV
jgi:hypothetical protein